MTNIRIDHNLKFKTATLGCFLRLPLDKKTLALANILACMQSNATKEFPGINLHLKREVGTVVPTSLLIVTAGQPYPRQV